MRLPLYVALGQQLIDQLGRGLPGDVEVLGQLGDGGPARGQPAEREAVRRAHVVEPAGPDPGGDAVDQGAAGRQQPEGQGLGVVVVHESSLTDYASSLDNIGNLLAYLREIPVPVIHPDQTAVHDMHGTSFTSYACPAHGSRELCAWHIEIPGQTTGVPHHVSREEVLYVLSGTIRATIDDQTEDASAGDVILVPLAPGSARTTSPTSR